MDQIDVSTPDTAKGTPMPVNKWKPGTAPVAVVMISLNEAHNMEAVLQNLAGWAQQVFLVDSCSADETVSIALKHGVHVVQRRFKGFGDQWNFALTDLPITALWTMKLDPDERLTDELKESIIRAAASGRMDGLVVNRRLWFMGTLLSAVQPILRVWKTGGCVFTDVAVNEHPLVDGVIENVSGYLEHHDSPDLDHWLVKQNRYTTTEAIWQYERRELAVRPNLFGNSLERRMWMKKNFWKMPGRYCVLFLYHLILLGGWRVGKIGFIWAHLRTEVYRIWEFKRIEIERSGKLPVKIPAHLGSPDVRVQFYD